MRGGGPGVLIEVDLDRISPLRTRAKDLRAKLRHPLLSAASFDLHEAEYVSIWDLPGLAGTRDQN